jgi:hypothetical protein
MKNIPRIILIVLLLLLVPLLGKWPWTLSDFVIMGMLLFGVGLIYELVVRKIGNKTRRIVFGVLLALAFLLIWADLAVGIFNIPGFSGS